MTLARTYRQMIAERNIKEEEMCSDKCCGQPVSECTCPPDCEHCDCNRDMAENYLGHSDAEKLNGGKSKDSSHDSAASHIDYHLRRHPDASKASGGERDKLRHQVAKKLGYHVEEVIHEEQNYKVEIEGLPMMFMTAKSPSQLKIALRKMFKKPDIIQNVERVPDAEVKRTFRLKAQGKEEEGSENE